LGVVEEVEIVTVFEYVFHTKRFGSGESRSGCRISPPAPKLTETKRLVHPATSAPIVVLPTA
jgi:hypothetical protein